jgi:hypothetical protein
MAHRLYLPGKRAPRYPLGRRICGSLGRSVRCEEENNLTLAGNRSLALEKKPSLYRQNYRTPRIKCNAFFEDLELIGGTFYTNYGDMC